MSDDVEMAKEVELDESTPKAEEPEETPEEAKARMEAEAAAKEAARRAAILGDKTLRQDYKVGFKRGDELVGEVAVLNGKFMKWASLSEHSQTVDDEGKAIHYLFTMITTKSEEGDLKLASILKDIHAADVNTHTYDARSGANVRITNIGATEERLIGFADAIDFMRSLKPEKIKVGEAVKTK